MASSEIPSRTLFVAEIPPNITGQQFQDLFGVYSGFKDARLRRDKNNNMVGFVEFENESCAGLGKAALQGYKWSNMEEKGLLIQFSRSDAAARKPRIHQVDPVYPMAPHSNGGHARRRDVMPNFAPNEFSSGSSVMTAFNSAQLPAEASSTLFVEGLPLDAAEREVAHIFRRMPGFQSLRIIPKEVTSTHTTDQPRTYNLCFVELDNKYQATTALHQLQGYRMEKDDPRTALNVSFAKKRKKNQPATQNSQLGQPPVPNSQALPTGSASANSNSSKMDAQFN